MTDTNLLIQFDGTGALTGAALPVTGLEPAEIIEGIDFQPSTGTLFALGNSSRLYTINVTTGAATAIGGAGAFTLSGTEFGFDFNPTVNAPSNLIRVTSDADQNLRLNPNGSLTSTDTPLIYSTTPADPNVGVNPNVVASAYTNSFKGAATTTLFGIDSNLDILVTQNPPNNGVLNTVGALGVNVTTVAGFDIAPGPAGTNTAYAALSTDGISSGLYTIDLTTGAAALTAAIDGGGRLVRSFAVVPETDLSVTKSDSPDPVLAGNNITYTIQVKNDEQSAAQGVVLTDVLPVGTTFVSLTAPAGWTPSTPAVGTNGTVSAIKATLDGGAGGGATETFTLVVKVGSGVSAPLGNTASISSATLDTNAANDSATSTTTVNAQADLSITKSDSVDPVTAGTVESYTITIFNSGPSDAQNVSLSDVVPLNSTFFSFAQNSGPGFTPTTPPVGGTGTVGATLATLTSGATATFTLMVKVNSDTPQNTTLSNTATVSSVTPDPTPGNNNATAATQVNTRADLSLSVRTEPEVSLPAGQVLKYFITITNNGPSDAQSISLSNPIPANTTPGVLGGSQVQNPGDPVFNVTTTPTLFTATGAALSAQPGQNTVTFMLPVTVATGLVDDTLIIDKPTVTLLTSDPNLANNSLTRLTTVGTPPDIFAVDGANQLVRFNSAIPGLILASQAITGLVGASEQIVAIDFRPATNQLFGLGITDPAGPANSEGRIYILDPSSGTATQVGSAPFSSQLADGARYGFNFNPVVDRIRVVNDADQNLRVNPNTGAQVDGDGNAGNGIQQDSALVFANGDQNFGANPAVVGVGYDRTGIVFGTPLTSLFGIDFASGALVQQGDADGTPSSPNAGQLNTVGPLGVILSIADGGFDIAANSDAAFATLTVGGVTGLYRITLDTGSATFISNVGAGTTSYRSLAVETHSLVIVGTAGNDALVLNASSTNAGSYTMAGINGGAPVAFTRTASLTFNGGAGDDVATINNPAGSLFAPGGQIYINGQTQTVGDSLVLAGGGGLGFAEAYRAGATADAGTIVTSNAALTQQINFTGLEPITDTVTVGSFDIYLTAGPDVVTVSNGPVVGALATNTIGDGPGGTYEDVTFANKGTVRVNALDGTDVFNLNHTAAASGLVTLELHGNDAGSMNPDDAATDTFYINVISAAATSAFGEGGDDQFIFANGARTAGQLNGGGGTDTVSYAAYATPVAVNLGANAPGGVFTSALSTDQEVPARPGTTGGDATLTYDPVTKNFGITVAVSGINPASVTGFHLHTGAFGANGPIIVDFGTAGLIASGDGFTFTAPAPLALPATSEAALFGGLTYINIHTPTAPGGQVRGQVFASGAFVDSAASGTGTTGFANIENIVGGLAGDSLIGNNVANVVRGGPGNDTIVGARGADTLAGEDEDDRIAWSNGDGTDVIDGAAGNDFVQVNGALGADDEFRIAANGTRVAFQRLNLVPFGLDIGGTESLIVNGATGDDIFEVLGLTGLSDLSSLSLNGLQGNDRFILGLPAGGTIPGAITLNINGGQPASDNANRDVVALNFDQPGDGPRSLVLTYLGGVTGGVDVGGLGGMVHVTASENVDFNGEGDDDSATIVGTVGEDVFTIRPTTANRALVFIGGNAPVGNQAPTLPGITGGSTGPDLGFASLSRLLIDGSTPSGGVPGDTFCYSGDGVVNLGGGGGTILNDHGFLTTDFTEIETLRGVDSPYQIAGDRAFPGQDDRIRLIRDSLDSSLVNLFINNTSEIPNDVFRLGLVTQIIVNSAAGNDVLTVDSSNGLLNTPNGIRFNGGTGTNTLRLEQSAGVDQAADTYLSGTLLGTGTSTITGPSGTQRVQFESVFFAVDSVPVATLTVFADQKSNTIDYRNAAAATNGLLVIDQQQNLEFTNKTALLVDALSGNDVVTLNNLFTPARLTSITFLGGDGNDTINAIAKGTTRLILNGGRGNDTLVGDGTLIGGPGDDTLSGGTGKNILSGDGGAAGGSEGAIGLLQGNQLVRFNPATPGDLGVAAAITGIQSGETIVGIDFRPGTDALYGLGLKDGVGRLYVIEVGEPNIGAATFVAQLTSSLIGTEFGLDFDPVSDRLRVTSDDNQNFSVNPFTGEVSIDAVLAYANDDVNFLVNPAIAASAFTNSLAGAETTILYGIDTGIVSGDDVLVVQTGGMLRTVGRLGVNADSTLGFDIDANGDVAFATLVVDDVAGLYSIDLTTGAATLIGNFENNTTLRGFALAPASGNDTLDGGGDDDQLFAGGGDDALIGGGGADRFDGGRGVDRAVEFRDANFTLTDNSLLIGNDLSDELNSIEAVELIGGVSANVFKIGPFSGRLTVTGGAGSDTLDLSNALGLFITMRGVSIDLDAVGSVQQFTSGSGTLILGDVIENFVGTAANDVIFADLQNFPRRIEGGSPSPNEPGVPPGDQLTIDGRGTFVQVTKDSPNSGKLAAPGYEDITFSGIESLTAANSTSSGGFSGANPNAFGAAVTYRVGRSPNQVITGKLNGPADQFDDIVVVNQASNIVTVLIAKGDGNFGAPRTFPTGARGPVSAAIGDVDGDGLNDIVVSNQASSKVTVLLNNGGFSNETTPVPFTVASRPGIVRLGDFNGDGRLDIGTLSKASSKITVLLNTGNSVAGLASFDRTDTKKTGGRNASDFVVANFDGDPGDHLDFAVAHRGSSNLTVLTGDGSGVFTLSQTKYKLGKNPTVLAMADFNNDGVLDVAVNYQVTRFVSVLLGRGNAGNGLFEPQLTTAFAVAFRAATTMVTGDFDADGNADLAFGSDSGAALRIALGSGTGLFEPVVRFGLGNTINVSNTISRLSSAIATGDFNGDGAPDIVVSNKATSDVSIVLRNPTV
ncbi:MAG: DUF4394 domain-containing protein [Chthoniobacteraceae bacterium]